MHQSCTKTQYVSTMGSPQANPAYKRSILLAECSLPPYMSFFQQRARSGEAIHSFRKGSVLSDIIRSVHNRAIISLHNHGRSKE